MNSFEESNKDHLINNIKERTNQLSKAIKTCTKNYEMCISTLKESPNLTSFEDLAQQNLTVLTEIQEEKKVLILELKNKFDYEYKGRGC